MNHIHPRLIRVGAALAVLAALLAFVARSAQGQAPPTQRLSLAEAARLAAAQTALVQSAQYRVQEAQARVTQSQSALRPQVSAIPNYTGHTVNSASFGFNFPAQAGSHRFSIRMARSSVLFACLIFAARRHRHCLIAAQQHACARRARASMRRPPTWRLPLSRRPRTRR
jgi:outer membrane protein TolC